MGRDILTSIQMYNSGNLYRKVLVGSHNEERSQNRGKWFENGFLTYQTWKLLEGIFKCRTHKCPRLKPSYGKKGSQERSPNKANRVWRLYLYYYWYSCFLREMMSCILLKVTKCIDNIDDNMQNLCILSIILSQFKA